MDKKFSELPIKLKLIILLDIFIGIFTLLSGILLLANSYFISYDIFNSEIFVMIFLLMASVILMITGSFFVMVGFWLMRLQLKGRTASIAVSVGIIPAILLARAIFMEIVPEELRIFANLAVWLFIISQITIIIYLVKDKYLEQLFDENQEN